MRSNNKTESGTWQRDATTTLLFCDSGQDLQNHETHPGLSALLWLRTKLKEDIFDKLAHPP
jgi:hypothetical protein